MNKKYKKNLDIYFVFCYNKNMEEFVSFLIFELFLKNPLFWLLIILGIMSLFFYKKIVGAAGEFWVKRELKKLSKEYLIINDYMIRIGNKTYQIDHIVVSLYGIFVIETKQYNGYLTGNDYDKTWIQYSGKKKYYINNPIHQNYGHIQALKKALELSDNKFISIVCISSRAKVKVKSNKVILIGNLITNIKSYHEKILLNYEEIYNKIISFNITSRQERREHVKNMKKYVKRKHIDNINKCPKCGSHLVERESKYGKFLGCSNYPRCKYIKNN